MVGWVWGGAGGGGAMTGLGHLGLALGLTARKKENYLSHFGTVQCCFFLSVNFTEVKHLRWSIIL